MGLDDVEDALPKIFELDPDFLIIISPNTALPGPAKAREKISNSDLPGIVITDAPGKKVKTELVSQGLGYIIITGDPLIGARKQFLDPIEMALFNSNISKVLAITGTFRIIQKEIDKVISSIKNGEKAILPQRIITVKSIRDDSDFNNPYAKAKAMAAYALAEKVAQINTVACFIEKESQKYIPLVACAHEIAQASARLAEEAREIEKCNDTVMRKPHAKSGKTKIKNKLMQSPVYETEVERSLDE
jgi:methylenetetrahydromethanopterin dehydrogenase